MAADLDAYKQYNKTVTDRLPILCLTYHLPIILVEYPTCFNSSGRSTSSGEMPPAIFWGVYAKWYSITKIIAYIFNFNFSNQEYLYNYGFHLSATVVIYLIECSVLFKYNTFPSILGTV